MARFAVQLWANSNARRGEAGVTERRFEGDGAPSHIVVARIAADIADVQDYGLAAEVLPPVRCSGGLGADFSGQIGRASCRERV